MNAQELLAELGRLEGVERMDQARLLYEHRSLLRAALALAVADDALDDARECCDCCDCCDCDPSDWRCGHAVADKSKRHDAALSRFRDAEKGGPRG